MGSPALLLGVDETAAYTSSKVDLEVGSTIVLFTDGVSERYGDVDIFGNEGIAEDVRRAEGSPEQIANEIMAAAMLHETPHDDDKVVFAIRVAQPRGRH